jgi:hypothetical protein
MPKRAMTYPCPKQPRSPLNQKPTFCLFFPANDTRYTHTRWAFGKFATKHPQLVY